MRRCLDGSLRHLTVAQVLTVIQAANSRLKSQRYETVLRTSLLFVTLVVRKQAYLFQMFVNFYRWCVNINFVSVGLTRRV